MESVADFVECAWREATGTAVPGHRGDRHRQSRPRHPGAGKKRSRPSPKGRQVDPVALGQVRALLGERPRRRDLLIEFLHLIQDEYHCLSTPQLAALAHEMRLAMAEVFEVASFYARFDVVRQGDAPPPPLTLRVCDSLSCELMGATRLLEELSARMGGRARVLRAPCMGRCDRAPVVEVGRLHVDRASPEAVIEAAAAGHTRTPLPEYQGLEAYRAAGGYALLGACRAGEREAGELISALDRSGLRGLGGAGFPAARKWELVRKAPRPRTVVINADEGEPGTFKDKYIMRYNPHLLIEGIIITSICVGIHTAYIYIRGEYESIALKLEEAIAEAVDKNYLGENILDEYSKHLNP